MNIFSVDQDPKIAAESLCDQHTSKMILESAQMLSTIAVKYGHKQFYKPTHKNHPSTLWAGQTYENWLWLCEHAIFMSEEKKKRTGKDHKSILIVKEIMANNYGPKNKDGLRPFSLAMPDYIKKEFSNDPVLGYKVFYLLHKQVFKNGKKPTWKNKQPPDWWIYKSKDNHPLDAVKAAIDSQKFYRIDVGAKNAGVI